jgi:site-specific DNA-methyltransferase (adenine-specific)
MKPVFAFGGVELYEADCLEWMDAQSENSIHACVTDPPYGFTEYTAKEQAKLRKGRGGIWRIPPTLDGYKRSPLPRFTTMTKAELEGLRQFFHEWAKRLLRVMVPGGHVMIASNPLVSYIVSVATVDAGFERRGEIVRLVQTLRGGDRPKNAHDEFPDVTVMPRSSWEPWLLLRKPCDGRVQDNLRKWGTGGLRRISKDQPFADVISSSPTRPEERRLAPHPSLKPQAFLRQVVRASLPLGKGILLDPFAGAGSTLAAAEAVGYRAVGVELDPHYIEVAKKGLPTLVEFKGRNATVDVSDDQLSIM